MDEPHAYICVCVCVCVWRDVILDGYSHTHTHTHTGWKVSVCFFFKKAAQRTRECDFSDPTQTSQTELGERRSRAEDMSPPSSIHNGSYTPFAWLSASFCCCHSDHSGKQTQHNLLTKKEEEEKKKSPLHFFFFFFFFFFTFWMLTALKMKLNLVEQQQHSSSSSSRFSVKDWKQIYSLDLSLFLWCMGEVLHKSVTAHKVVPFYLQFI